MTPLEAVQASLRAEHAAVYLYGVLGARTSASAEPALAGLVRDTYGLHLRRRDELEAMVRELGGRPAIAATAYRLPSSLRRPEQVRTAALGIESRCAQTYAQQVGSTTGPQRRWGLAALTDAAVRQLQLGGQPDDYPGLPELMAP